MSGVGGGGGGGGLVSRNSAYNYKKMFPNKPQQH